MLTTLAFDHSSHFAMPPFSRMIRRNSYTLIYRIEKYICLRDSLFKITYYQLSIPGSIFVHKRFFVLNASFSFSYFLIFLGASETLSAFTCSPLPFTFTARYACSLYTALTRLYSVLVSGCQDSFCPYLILINFVVRMEN